MDALSLPNADLAGLFYDATCPIGMSAGTAVICGRRNGVVSGECDGRPDMFS